MFRNEFKARVKDIKKLYNCYEGALIDHASFKDEVCYDGSSFYDIKFSDTKELATIITVMISDAIKCYKKQSSFMREWTVDFLADLRCVQTKLIYIELARK